MGVLYLKIPAEVERQIRADEEWLAQQTLLCSENLPGSASAKLEIRNAAIARMFAIECRIFRKYLATPQGDTKFTNEKVEQL